jgi:hypothetical protein
VGIEVAIRVFFTRVPGRSVWCSPNPKNLM